MAVPPAPSFYGDTIPAVVTPTDTIRFRAYCADALTLSAYFEPVQNDPMPIWYEETIEPDDVWGGVPVFYVEIPLAQTSVTAGEWRIGIRAHNNDGYSTHSYKSVRVAELPTVEITSPTEGGSIENMPLLITWNSSDATGISEQKLYVYDGDLSNPVLYRTLDGDARTSVIGIEDAAFENDSEYTVIVGAFNGVGLYASDTVHFRTHWPAPAVPTATVTTDPTDLSASVTAFGNVTYDLGEGESLAVREGGTLASLTVHGKSVQDGTPSQSSPVEIQSVEGRNLLDTSISQTTTAGVTYTNGSDGSVVLNGTKYGSGYAVIKSGIGLFLPAGTYRFNAQLVSGTAGSSPTIYLLDASATVITSITPNTAGALATTTVTLTDAKTVNALRFGLWKDNAVYADATHQIWLEYGSTAHGYQPYGSITLVTGSDRTPIDLQGHALRSLPDGTEDTLEVDGEGNVSMVQRVGETTSATTDGITATIGTDAMSTTGTLADGATVIYKLATTQTISLGTIDLPYADADSTVSVDAAVTPTISGTVKTMEYAGQPETDHLVVARVNADGTRWVVASGLRSGETCIDPLPPLGVEYSYAVTAVTEAGTTSVATVTRTVESTAWALNFGANAAEVITLVGNPKASYSLDQGGEAYHFADGGAGGGLPVWYGTTDRDESGTLYFDTMLWHDSDRLRELCRQYPVAWLRDPFGHRWRAHVQPKISHGIGEVWQVSINWDAVRFEEAW